MHAEARRSIGRLMLFAMSLGSTSIAAALAPSTAGSPDPTFGAGGIVYANPTPGIDQGIFGAVQPDGKFVIAGGISTGTGEYSLGVLRLLDNGNPDPGFGVNGLANHRIDIRNFGESVYVADDGKLYVVGFARFFGSSVCAVVRLLADGRMESTYGQSGIVRFHLGAAGGQPFCYRGAARRLSRGHDAGPPRLQRALRGERQQPSLHDRARAVRRDARAGLDRRRHRVLRSPLI